MIWRETLRHHSPEIAPRFGTMDPLAPGFIKRSGSDGQAFVDWTVTS